MKITNKYLMFVGVTLLLASCELDKEMEGQYIGGEQNENIIAQRPNMTVAAVNGMSAKLNAFATVSTAEEPDHNDYGGRSGLSSSRARWTRHALYDFWI